MDLRFQELAGFHFDDIASFNDQKGRTVAEVIALCDKVAAS